MFDRNHITVHIVTPERVMYSGAALSVVIPTEAGELTIKPHHQPIMATLRAGELRLIDTEQAVQIFAIDTGVVHVDTHNVMTVLADRSETLNELDLGRAEAAYARARVLQEEQCSDDEVQFARFEAIIEKELNRARIARKYKG